MLNLENMRPWEKISMVIRRHWITYFILWSYFFIGLVITISLYFILWAWIWTNLLQIIFWLFFSLFLYIEWLNHELDLFIVTNNRIIWVEQKSFLDRTVSECNLWQVQEVNSSTKWFFSNIFNYGSIFIQTAWSSATLKMDFAPNSLQWARKMLNIVDEYRNKHSSFVNMKEEIKEDSKEGTE